MNTIPLINPNPCAVVISEERGVEVGQVMSVQRGGEGDGARGGSSRGEGYGRLRA